MRDVLTSAFAYLLIAGSNLATGVLAARLLGPDGRGELAAVLLYPQLAAALTTTALVDAVIYWMANAKASPAETFGSAALLGGLGGLAVMALGWALVPLLYADYRPEVHEAARLYFLFVPLGAVALYATGLFQGGLAIGRWNLLRVFVALSYLAFVLLLAVLGEMSVLSFAAASLAGNLATLALALVLMARAGWLGFRPRLPAMRGFLAYVWPIHLGAVLVILNGRLDQVLVSQWESAEAFGFYVVALGLLGAAGGFTTLLSALAFPKVAAQREEAARVEVLGRYLRLSVAVALAVVLGVLLLGRPIVGLLYGEAFLPAVAPLQVLALGAVALAAKTILVQGLKAFDRTGPISGAEGLGLAVNAVALVVLVRAYGITGAALAYLLAQAVTFLFLAVAARRAAGLPVAAMLMPRAGDLHRVLAGMRGLARR